VTALAGCASGSDTGAPSSDGVTFEKKNPLTIGYSVYDTQASYWQAYIAGVKAEAAKNDVEVIIADQKQQQQAQVSGSADLINQNISALIVSPIQPPALPATITAAHNAKIPVIIGDVGAAGDYDAYISSDNASGGELAADYVIDALAGSAGPHKVGVIGLPSGSAVGDARVSGFTDKLAGNPAFEVAATLDGEGTVDGGFAAAQDMLSANPGLQAIYAANDEAAQGASRAIEAAGKDLSTFVLIGFNGDQPALDLIEQGKMTATVAQDPYAQGELAVQTALALLDGDTPDYMDATDRTLAVPVQIVDAENLSTFQADRADQK
jgi:ribose transport system substrate-binding protein